MTLNADLNFSTSKVREKRVRETGVFCEGSTRMYTVYKKKINSQHSGIQFLLGNADTFLDSKICQLHSFSGG